MTATRETTGKTGRCPLSQRVRREERQIRATAHHEAGHAAMAELLDIPYRSVSIVPTGSEAGRVILTPRAWPERPDPFDARLRNRVENMVMVFMAGFIAERLFTGRSSNVHACSDRAATWELMERVAFSERERSLHLDALFARCLFLMRRRAMRRCVRAIARTLLERGTLRRGDVARVVIAAWRAERRRPRLARLKSL